MYRAGMAVFWIHDECEREWRPVPLAGRPVWLAAGSARVEMAPHPPAEGLAAVIVPCDAGGWAIASRPGVGVWVNGDPLLLGLRVLRDHDAIRVGAGEVVFYSGEAIATVVPFAGPRAIPCARCRRDIELQAPAVECPRCHSWHHQVEDSECWTYAPTCGQCDQPARVNGEYQWRPEVL